MGQRYEEIKNGGGEVLAISFESLEGLIWLGNYLSLPFQLLSDPSMSTYRMYGLSSGSIFRVLGPRVVWAYIKLVLRGRRFRVPLSDMHQLGGDFIVDSQGVLVFAYRQKGPENRPSVDGLIRRLRRRG